MSDENLFSCPRLELVIYTKMITIFANVVADIDGDLAKSFPDDFDYIAMIKQLSDEAGVDVLMKNGKDISMKGIWASIERVHGLLMTALGMYGSYSNYNHSLSETVRTKNLSQTYNSLKSNMTYVSEKDRICNDSFIPSTTNLIEVKQEPLADEPKDVDDHCQVRFKEVQEKEQDVNRTNKEDEHDIPRINESESDHDDCEFSVCETNDDVHRINPEIKQSELSGQHLTIKFPKRTKRKSTSESEVTVEKEDNHDIFDDGNQCSDCDFNANSTCTLEQHRTQSHNKSVSTCRLCKMVFPGRKEMIKHFRKTHLPTAEKSKKRTVKSSQISTKKVFSESKRKKNADESSIKVAKKIGRPRRLPDGPNGEYKCSDCDYSGNRNTLKDHRARHHLKTPTPCEICQKIFPYRIAMLRHRKAHDAEPQHCCDVCGKMYKNKKVLLQHRATHAEGYTKPSFQCHLCDKAYISSYVLSCHVKKDHLGMHKGFLCSICGKSFTLQFSLKEHFNTHTGAKPNVCDICGKCYTFRSALRVHKMTHVAEKRFECSVCSKGFNTPKDLRQHERTHNPHAERPFMCKHCSKSFYDASKIRRHLKMVHKIDKSVSTWREDVIYSKSSVQELNVSQLNVPLG